MSSERLKKIFKENAEFERESPYNFCDRWCARCPEQTQGRCRVFQEELEQKLTCIAHGRDEDDPEIIAQVMNWQQAHDEDGMWEDLDNLEEIDLENSAGAGFEKIRDHLQFVENHSLPPSVDQYRQRASVFLKETFFSEIEWDKNIRYDFETLAWYHTLLPVKLQRALAGFHEPVTEDDIALNDAVAQLVICKKGIKLSVEALGRLNCSYPQKKIQVIELVALLRNIESRIEGMIEGIK